MTSSPHAIQTTGLRKQFSGGLKGKGVVALNDVSLTVNHGDIFGLLGPNGAGKTTLVKILLGSLNATAGTASVNGHDCRRWQARRKIGFLPENHRFPNYQTGMQMLLHYGGMAGMARSDIRRKAQDLLALVGMDEWQKTKIKKYSKGMMQRLGLAQALLNDPDIIFLDEPTDGVDPIGRSEIRDVLLKLKKEGKTIFLNSHLLAEVEMICDHVAILDKGKLIKSGPVSGLISSKPSFKIETDAFPDNLVESFKADFPSAVIDGTTIVITLEDAKRINRVVDWLRKNAVDILAVVPQRISLEESFMKLIRGEGGHE